MADEAVRVSARIKPPFEDPYVHATREGVLVQGRNSDATLEGFGSIVVGDQADTFEEDEFRRCALEGQLFMKDNLDALNLKEGQEPTAKAMRVAIVSRPRVHGRARRMMSEARLGKLAMETPKSRRTMSPM